MMMSEEQWLNYMLRKAKLSECQHGVSPTLPAYPSTELLPHPCVRCYPRVIPKEEDD